MVTVVGEVITETGNWRETKMERPKKMTERANEEVIWITDEEWRGSGGEGLLERPSDLKIREMRREQDQTLKGKRAEHGELKKTG